MNENICILQATLFSFNCGNLTFFAYYMNIVGQL